LCKRRVNVQHIAQYEGDQRQMQALPHPGRAQRGALAGAGMSRADNSERYDGEGRFQPGAP
jgi:hypothetical protein